MQPQTSKSIHLQPDELHFEQVQSNKTYIKELSLTNTLSSPVELHFRPSSSEKLEIRPKMKKLGANQTATVEVKLHISRLPPSKRSGPTIIKETISIKSNFFDQKASVFLHISEKSPLSHSFERRGKDQKRSLSDAQRSLTFGRLPMLHGSTEDIHKMHLLQPESPDFPEMYLMTSGEEKPEERKEKRIDHLQAQNYALGTELDNREREIEEILQQRDQEVESAREKERARMNQLEFEIQELKIENEELRQQLSQVGADDPAARMREMLKEKDPQLQKLVALSLQEERARQEQKDEQIVEILANKDALIEQLEQALEGREKQAEELNEEVRQLGSRINELNGELEEKTEKIKDLGLQIQKLKLQGSELGQITEIRSVSESLEVLRSELAQERAKNNELEGQLEQSRRELNYTEARYSELKAKEEFVKELGARQKKLQSENEALLKGKDQTISELSIAVKEMRLEEDKHLRKIEVLQEQIEAIKEMQAKRDDGAEIARMYEAQLEEKGRLALQGEELKGMVQKMTEELQKARGEIAHLELANADAARERKLLLEKEEWESERIELLRRLDQTGSMVQEKSRMLQAAQKENLELLSAQEVIRKDTFCQTTSVYAEIEMEQDRLKQLERESEEYRIKAVSLEGSRNDLKRMLSALQSEKKQWIEAEKQMMQKIESLETQKLNLALGTEIASESQVVIRLNSRIAQMKAREEKLQREVTQQEIRIQSILRQHQRQMDERYPRRDRSEEGPDRSMVVAAPKSEKGERKKVKVMEGVDLEVLVMQLREELVASETARVRATDKAKYEKLTLEGKIAALEKKVSYMQEQSKKKKQKSNPGGDNDLARCKMSLEAAETTVELLRGKNAEIETENAQLRGLVELVKREKLEIEEQYVRKQKNEKLEKYLPHEYQIQQRLAQKITQQKEKQRRLEGLLRRAKQSYDLLSQKLQYVRMEVTNKTSQSRKVESVEKQPELEESLIQQIEAPRSEIGTEPPQRVEEVKQEMTHVEMLQKKRLENRVKELQNQQAQISGRKYGEALHTISMLRDEYSSKLVSQEQHATEEYEGVVRELGEANLQNERLRAQIDAMEKQQVRMHAEGEEARRALEGQVKEVKDIYKQLKEEAVKKEKEFKEMELRAEQSQKVAQERSSQIAVLLETVETYQSECEDQNKQKMLNMSAGLCSAQAVIAASDRKIAELSAIVAATQREMSRVEQEAKEMERIKSQTDQLVKGLKIDMKARENELNERKMKESSLETALNERMYQIDRLMRQKEKLKEELEIVQRRRNKEEKEWKQELENQQKRLEEKLQSGVEHKQGQRALRTQIQKLMVLLHGMEGAQNDQAIKELGKILLAQDSVIAELERRVLKEKMRGEMPQGPEVVRINRMERALKENAELKRRIARYESAEGVHQRRVAQRESQRIKQIEEEMKQLHTALLKEQSERAEIESQKERAMSELDQVRRKMQRRETEYQSQRLLNIPILGMQQSQQKMEKFMSELSGESEDLKREIVAQKSENLRLQEETSSQKKALVSVRITITQLNQLLEEAQERVATLEMKKTMTHAEEKLRRIEKCLEELEKEEPERIDSILKTIYTQRLYSLQKEIEQLKFKEILRKEHPSTGQSVHTSFGMPISKEAVEMDLEDQLREKEGIIEALERKAIEQRAAHIQELQAVEVQKDLQLAEKRAQLQREYRELNERFRPGEAPGQMRRTNELLKHRSRELEIQLERLSGENLLIVRKLDSLSKENQRLQDGSQLLKKALGQVQGIFLQSENKESEMPSHLQPSRLALAYIDSRISEAEALRKVRSAARTEVELRERIKQLNTQQRDTEGTIRMLERTLKSYELASQARGEMAQSQDTEANGERVLSRRVLELEAENQELKLAQAQASVFFTPSPKLIDSLLQPCEAQEEVYISLVNGFIELVDQLYAKTLIRGKVNTIGLNSSVISLPGFQSMRPQDSARYSQSPARVERAERTSMAGGMMASELEIPAGSIAIQEAQRLVIKTLSDRIKASGGCPPVSMPSAPLVQTDRHIWYLELLESQVQAARKEVARLQDFTKKVQIEVSGDLASAAQVKAASLELSKTVKGAASEISTLQQICKLIQTDAKQAASQVADRSVGATLLENYRSNPIEKTETYSGPPISLMQSQGASHVETRRYLQELLNENQSLKNRVAVSEKVKAQMENELVQHRLKTAYESEELREGYARCQRELEKFRSERAEEDIQNQSIRDLLDQKERRLIVLEQDAQRYETQLNEKEKELEDLLKTKQMVARQTQKLEAEMKAWKSGTQDKIVKKDLLVKELQNRVHALSEEIEQTHRKMQILRQDKKVMEGKMERLESEKVRALNAENADLERKLAKELDSRKGEVEFWIQERRNFQERVDKLEAENVQLKRGQMSQRSVSQITGPGISTVRRKERERSAEREIQQKEKRLRKAAKREKWRRMELEVSERREETIRLREEIARILGSCQMREREAMQLREQLEQENNVREEVARRLGELEERTLKHEGEQEDEIKEELKQLRECFEELRSERDKLVREMSCKLEQEEAKKEQTEEMIVCMRDLDKERVRYKREHAQMAQEQETLVKARKELLDQVHLLETKLEGLEQQNSKLKMDRQHVTIQKQRVDNERESLEIRVQEAEAKMIEMRREMKETLQSQEETVDTLKRELLKQMEAMEKTQKLHEMHVGILRQRQSERLRQTGADRKKSEQTAQNMIQVAQKEAVIKQLRAEMKTLKVKLAVKEKESNQPERDAGNKKKKIIPEKKQVPITEGELKIQAERAKLIRELASQEATIVALKNELVGKDTKLQIAEDRLGGLEQQTENQEQQRSEEQGRMKALNKEIQEKDRQHRIEVSRLREELMHVKERWMTPERGQELEGMVKDLEAQLRSTKEEVHRKRELLTTFRQEKEQTKNEANELLQEINMLKDDAEKVRRLTRESLRKENALKEMRTMLEAVRMSERKLLEENVNLTDKIRALRSDISRKEAIIRELREKADGSDNLLQESRARTEEVEKVKEQLKKAKLENERKDNQTKALKSKIHELQAENEKMKMERSAGSSQGPVQTEIERESRRHQQTRFKLRKTEAATHRLLIFVRRLLRELVTDVRKLRQRVNAERRAAQTTKKKKQEGSYLKEGLDILELSLDDLQDFVGGEREIPSKNEDLDALLEEMDEIVQEEGKQFSDQDMFKAFMILLQEKRSLEGEAQDHSFRLSEKQNLSRGNSQMRHSVEKYENYLENLRKKEARELTKF